MEDPMTRALLAAGAAAAFLIGSAGACLALQLQDRSGFPPTAIVQDYAGFPLAQPGADDRLLIINGNNHRVIYDDGDDDLICITRHVIVGHNAYGRPIYRRTMHCR
jgi:hypothetical protein